eukprot:CAMPEP_0173387174 /NCGR_PEP_ID=MMETSP1356-20130122/9705_1 /TAXON_ID=77927 ORGANISM="Hemiselmis virescens, Strain PCC157" /NCGR_SAMPLE_ID=MMETSP1356 /ASSEMBLY_ACC=CAM_ASM_000847 /LENGTH=111 /DNA_ID=CAMNT_0014343683 /DNA_START=22 /DNA_END=357 /DNA_ORIENTATION=+
MRDDTLAKRRCRDSWCCAVGRTAKELASYEKEIKDQTDKIEKMRAEEADFHDIKQQDEVLKEAQTCLADAKRRLDGAASDLESLMAEEGDALAEAPEFEEAQAMVKQYVVD